MERVEAEAIYGRGREVVVVVLLRMDEQIRRLGERVARQDERIAELERRLNRNSRNSSNPPSQDPPGTPERRRADPSGRGRGAQPGHPGRGRGLLPLEAVDLVVDHWPPGCGCGRPFAEDEREPICDPARHQVCELPEIAVRVSEHRLHRLRCPDCGASARAELPAAVPAGAFGPRLEAAIATLAVRNRVSRRDTVELCEELFGARLSSGTVDAILGRAAAALAEPHEDLLDHIRCAPAVNIDETGWRLKGERRTLWGAATPVAAVFRIAPDRHEREATWLLGEDFEGVVGSDRWWAYRGFDPARRQLCWSHLIRDFTAHAEGSPPRGSSASRGSTSPGACSTPGSSSNKTATAGASSAGWRRSSASSRRCFGAARRASATSSSAASRRTCSRSGRRSGPSPRSPASSRPTTGPSARCADRSSSASSHLAANPTAVSAASSASSPPPSPAAYSAARCSPT